LEFFILTPNRKDDQCSNEPLDYWRVATKGPADAAVRWTIAALCIAFFNLLWCGGAPAIVQGAGKPHRALIETILLFVGVGLMPAISSIVAGVALVRARHEKKPRPGIVLLVIGVILLNCAIVGLWVLSSTMFLHFKSL
jgi:hypothetical protein